MSNILTKKIQIQLSDYFSSSISMTKPELRCLRDMAVGILKSKSVFVNQIAASLREPLKLKFVAKRLSAQYLKDDYADKVLENHLQSIAPSIHRDDFLLLDGSDIIKACAQEMEGLEYVKDGDTGSVGLGYNLININAINTHKEITPVFSKAYSYQMGAFSSNNEIKKAISSVAKKLDGKGCWVIDRGGDNCILKDFLITQTPKFILRLKRNTQLYYKGEALKVSQIAKRATFIAEQSVVKIKKNKTQVQAYGLAAVEVSYFIKRKKHQLWLVISRNKKHGGLTYLLVKPHLKTPVEVAKWAFKGYGMRWKIEEYHRHVKQEYKLEDIQIKTFTGLQSMLATLTVAMYIIYKKVRAMHFELLLDAGYNYLNKNVPRELTNFIYYKISKVVAILLMPVRLRWKIMNTEKTNQNGQLNLSFI